MKKFFKEFGEFIKRGNVMDLAVGIIIGGAFQSIVKSLVGDIITPVISIITGGIDFSNLFILLGQAPEGVEIKTIADAQAAGIATLAYGNFITAVINFLIMAFVVFCFVKGLRKLETLAPIKLDAEEEPKEPTTKKCPFCQSEIDIKATRCPHCTSVIPEEEGEEESEEESEEENKE